MELCWGVALWLPLASGSSSQKVLMLPETRPPCIRDCSSQLLLFGFSRGGNRFKVWRHCYGILLGFWLYYCRSLLRYTLCCHHLISIWRCQIEFAVYLLFFSALLLIPTPRRLLWMEHDPKVISFLLDTGIISLCLRGMEIGSELSKTVAIFIVQKIISDNAGLAYICSKPEQFYSLSDHLRSVVEYLSQQQQPSQRMLTHILRCYLRLTVDSRACTKLQTCLPGALRDASLGSNINDEATTSLLQELLHKVYG